MKTVTTVVLLALAINCFGQLNFGIQIEMGGNSLTGISTDTIVPYGLSGAKHSNENDFFISPSLRVRKDLSDRFSLETGIGYLSIRNRIHLQFYDDFFRTNVDTSLKIKLHYLSVPLACNYSVPLTTNTSLFFMATVSTDVLISQKDNFEDIILNEIAWVERDDWYTRIVFVPSLSVGYQFNIKDISMAELSLLAGMGVNPFVNEEGWGYYENLKNARSFRYGLMLKYYIN